MVPHFKNLYLNRWIKIILYYSIFIYDKFIGNLGIDENIQNFLKALFKKMLMEEHNIEQEYSIFSCSINYAQNKNTHHSSAPAAVD